MISQSKAEDLYRKIDTENKKYAAYIIKMMACGFVQKVLNSICEQCFTGKFPTLSSVHH